MNQSREVPNRCKEESEIDYYCCGSCGLELSGDEVDGVPAGMNCASGEFCCCPACGEENLIERSRNE